MKLTPGKLVVMLFAAALAVPVFGQIYRYYNNGTIWTVSMIKVEPGKDAAYLEYLDGAFKKEADAQVKANYMKSYKILRTLDDDYSSWNFLLLREYTSLAQLEADEEKSDNLSRKVLGEDDAKAMQGYENRAKVREVIGDRTLRELILK
jgi:hypothetical protein